MTYVEVMYDDANISVRPITVTSTFAGTDHGPYRHIRNSPNGGNT